MAGACLAPSRTSCSFSGRQGLAGVSFTSFCFFCLGGCLACCWCRCPVPLLSLPPVHPYSCASRPHALEEWRQFSRKISSPVECICVLRLPDVDPHGHRILCQGRQVGRHWGPPDLASRARLCGPHVCPVALFLQVAAWALWDQESPACASPQYCNAISWRLCHELHRWVCGSCNN